VGVSCVIEICSILLVFFNAYSAVLLYSGRATMWLAYVTGVAYANYLYKIIFSSHASEADHE